MRFTLLQHCLPAFPLQVKLPFSLQASIVVSSFGVQKTQYSRIGRVLGAVLAIHSLSLLLCPSAGACLVAQSCPGPVTAARLLIHGIS